MDPMLQKFWVLVNDTASCPVVSGSKNRLYMAETGFCDLKHESSPLSVYKNMGDCMRSLNGSNGTTIAPALFWLYNTFK